MAARLLMRFTGPGRRFSGIARKCCGVRHCADCQRPRQVESCMRKSTATCDASAQERLRLRNRFVDGLVTSPWSPNLADCANPASAPPAVRDLIFAIALEPRGLQVLARRPITWVLMRCVDARKPHRTPSPE
jgi:hypothetical protein